MSWQKTIDYVSQTCVAGHLRILNRVVTNIYDDAFRPLGLKISQANILIIVAQQDVTRPAEVCERLQLGASTLSRNVERMRAKGWLEIVPSEDARTQSFRLTAQGKNLLEQAYPLWQEAQRRAAEILGKEEIVFLNRTANKLRSAIESV
ncbi:MAG TPA: MarR family winged helix-turn-helix transcriptional regulator [Gemmataceae bacterium]|jgi:DNA-binding MarR family transcriptional regulator|nr:MarR family winged helix-turn-helix transcriptional regulator [Gemmataceae bacterium]